MNITTAVNGKRIQAGAPTGQTLPQFLHEQGYRSVKRGRETTSCGLCSVWMDEKIALSCSVPVKRADGHRITTLEGVGKEARGFAGSIAEEGVEQRGFCSPGMMMQVFTMKREDKTWTDEEIKHWLTGSLCRRTGYVGQPRTIRAWLLKEGEAA